MRKKVFNDTVSYFKFVNKYKDKINVIKVKPGMTKKGYQVVLYYEKRD